MIPSDKIVVNAKRCNPIPAILLLESIASSNSIIFINAAKRRLITVKVISSNLLCLNDRFTRKAHAIIVNKNIVVKIVLV